MNILIGVMSCEHDSANGCHDVIRRTWVSHLVPGLDYKLFVGRGTRALAPDEERLDVGDDYYSLPEKSQAMRKWALEHGYEHMFKADRDTYLSPKRLLASGFDRADYVGHFPAHPQEGLMPVIADGRGVYAYASGGCGYWTNKPAMEAIAAAPLDEKRLDNRGKAAEDLWIPNILYPLGLRGYHDPRYIFKGDRLNLYGYQGISVHLGAATGVYTPAMMDRAHQLSAGCL